MKSVTADLYNLLATGRYMTANLYTLTLLGGVAMRVTDAPDFDAVWSGNSFSHDLLALERGSIRQGIGIEVDSVDMTLLIKAGATLNGLPIPHFVRNGGFNGARMLVQRGYFPISAVGNVNTTATGVIFSFEGRLADARASRTQVTFRLVADTELLNKMVPLNTITPHCMNQVFDGRCGKTKADFTRIGTVATASKTAIACGLAEADGYYSLGTVRFTGGQNAGAMRTVKTYTTGHFVLASAFEYTPEPGDTFEAVAGCDLSAGVCLGTFNNLANRRAFPWVPVYEESL